MTPPGPPPGQPAPSLRPSLRYCPAPRPPPLIALLTDFGLAGAYAGVLHGVVAGIAPHTRVIDLCHEVPPQDVRAGAFLLLTSYRFFPPGTIFGAVVDPGVGTGRAIVVVRAGGHIFAGPDNGLLRWAVEDAGPVQEAVRVEAAPLPPVPGEQHLPRAGRDRPRRGPPLPGGAPLRPRPTRAAPRRRPLSPPRHLRGHAQR